MVELVKGTETSILLKIFFFLAFFGGLIALGMPSQYLPIGVFDFLLFGGEMLALMTACVITTGIPCAVILVASWLVNILAYFTTSITIISIIILTPIQYIVTYILYRLAKGGG